MATGGSNGTCKGSTAGPSGNAATVHFPDPVPTGRDEEYLNLTAAQLAVITSATGTMKVDVTMNAAGDAVSTVTAHNP